MSKKSDLGKLALGAAIGVGAGVLLVPRSGNETRELLKGKMKELVDKVKHLDSKEIKDEFDKKIKELEKELKELDKEKVISIAKEKASLIKEKADKLVELAVEKGDAAIEKTAKEVRSKAIDVTKNVLAKLEESK